MNVLRSLFFLATYPTEGEKGKEAGWLLFPLLQVLHNLLPLLKLTPVPISRHIQQHNLRLSTFRTPDPIGVHLRSLSAFVARTTYLVVDQRVYE